MRKALIALGAVLALLLAAVLIGPSFVDANAKKALITEEGRKATGRDLTIDGDVSLSILPTPALSAKKVRLANIEGGSAPAMIELDELEVRVAMLPLIQGRLQVESVALVAPRILLETLPDGRRNWDFDKAPEEPAAVGETATPESLPETTPESAPESAEDVGARVDEAAGGGPDAGFVVQVDSFSVEDGSLVYRDAVSGREERLEDIDAEIVAESLQGPFTVEGQAVHRGIPLRLVLAVGRLLDAGATPLNVELGLPEADARGQLSGSLSLHPDSVELRGKLRGEGKNLRAVVAAISDDGSRALPPMLANAFKLEATISADSSEASVSDLVLIVGDTTIDGSGQLQLEPAPLFNAKLSASRLDLDELLAGARGQDASKQEDRGAAQKAAADGSATGAAAPAGGSEAPSAPDAAAALQIPADLSGSLELAVDALIYRQQIARQIRFNAAVSEGAVTVNQAMALLPGGSDVSLTGSVTSGETGPRFVGRVEAASDNLRGVLGWLGAELSQVPADRLRKMNFSGRVDATASQVSLSEIDLRVDVSRLAGGVVAALRERPGLGIGLSLDSVNLDAYLPEPAATAGASDAGGTAGAEAPADGSAGETESPQRAAGSPGSPGLLGAFDANLNLRIGSLVLKGQTAKDVRVEGTLKDGDLLFKQASVAELSGSSLAYAGRITGLGATPSLDGTLTLKIADPVRMARLAGVEDPLVARIGPFNMTGNLKGNLEGFGLNARFAALGGRFGLVGTARPVTAPASFDMTVEGKHPDLAKLLKVFDPDLDLAPGLGGLDAKARVAGTPLKLKISDVNGSFGPLALTGGMDADLAGPKPQVGALDFVARLQHPNLAQLVRSVGGPDDLGGELGGVDLSGKVKGDARAIQVSEISGSLGPLGLAGSLAANLSGETPGVGDFDLNVRVNHPDLARLVTAAGAPGAIKSGVGGVDLSARARGNARQVDLQDLKGRLGPVDLSGTARAELGGAKPKLALDLTTGELPISALLGDGPGGVGGAAGGGGGSLSSRWSGKPLDLGALQAVNADVKLRSTAMIYEKFRLENAQLQALLTDGLLDLKQLAGTLFGGALQATGKAQAGNGLDGGLAVTAVEVDSGRLLRSLSGFDRVSGPVTINASLQSRGRSEAELVSALAGKGDVAGQVTIRAKVEEAAGAALLNLLGDKVKEVRGAAATTNSLLTAFAGSPSTLSGTFQVDRGVVRSTDLRLQGRDAIALTKGTADLPAWLVNSRTEVYRGNERDTPFLTLALSGVLDDPNIKVGGQPFQRRKEEEPAASGESSGSEPAPEEKKKKSKTDQAEDLLKGLLKKLGD